MSEIERAARDVSAAKEQFLAALAAYESTARGVPFAEVMDREAAHAVVAACRETAAGLFGFAGWIETELQGD